MLIRKAPLVNFKMADTSESSTLALQICNLISTVFTTPTTTQPPLTILVNEISSTNGKIFVYGVGREGLMLKAFCMRLFHLGLSTHCVFDMTTPPIASSDDLLIVSAGPGSFSTVDALCELARSVGARVVLITAQPDAVKYADVVAYVPAQTMADDDRVGSVLPMGSVYEGALFVLFEMVVFQLTKKLGRTAEELRARHTNLE